MNNIIYAKQTIGDKKSKVIGRERTDLVWFCGLYTHYTYHNERKYEKKLRMSRSEIFEIDTLSRSYVATATIIIQNDNVPSEPR